MTKDMRNTLIQLGVWALLLCITAAINNGSLGLVLSESLQSASCLLLFALAMAVTVKIGVGPNFALPIGIVCGKFAMIMAIMFGCTGLGWLMVSLLIAIASAAIVGIGHGVLLSKMKSHAKTSLALNWFLGLTVAAIFSVIYIIWMPDIPRYILMDFVSRLSKIRTISLEPFGGKQILDNFLSFNLGQFVIPFGLILILVIICVLLWYFKQVKPKVETTKKDCFIAGVVSTMLGAVGIIIYSQSYGFIQAYDGATSFTFWIAAAIFLGGITLKKAGLRQVIMGLLLYSGLLALLPAIPHFFYIRLLMPYGIIIFVLLKEVWRRKGDKEPETEISHVEAPIHDDELTRDSRELLPQ